MLLSKTIAILMLTFGSGEHINHPRYGAEMIAEAVDRTSREADMSPQLVLAVALVESRLNWKAKGSAGEWGLWQLHPDWWGSAKELCGMDPAVCVHTQALTAMFYLRRALHQCKTLKHALGMYNTGRCGGNDEYAANVMREMAYIKSLLRTEYGNEW